jgi:phage tail sheath gpL-like
MKSDLAGGQMPAALFGVNAAWWAIVVLAFNLNALMTHLVLPEGWASKRRKRDCALVSSVSRGECSGCAARLIVRLTEGHPASAALHRGAQPHSELGAGAHGIVGANLNTWRRPGQTEQRVPRSRFACDHGSPTPEESFSPQQEGSSTSQLQLLEKASQKTAATIALDQYVQKRW